MKPPQFSSGGPSIRGSLCHPANHTRCIVLQGRAAPQRHPSFVDCEKVFFRWLEPLVRQLHPAGSSRNIEVCSTRSGKGYKAATVYVGWTHPPRHCALTAPLFSLPLVQNVRSWCPLFPGVCSHRSIGGDQDRQRGVHETQGEELRHRRVSGKMMM